MSQPKKLKKINMIIQESEEPPEPVGDILSNINNDLEKLRELSSSSSVNMSDILNLHNSINTKIEQVSERVETLKIEFNNTKHKPLKEINSQTFQQYMDEINSLSGELDADTEIEKLIKSYKESLHKINLCENYLKSKQMNLIYCDVNDDNNDDN
jgi:archaellum component FlaC